MKLKWRLKFTYKNGKGIANGEATVPAFIKLVFQMILSKLSSFPMYFRYSIGSAKDFKGWPKGYLGKRIWVTVKGIEFVGIK